LRLKLAREKQLPPHVIWQLELAVERQKKLLISDTLLHAHKGDHCSRQRNSAAPNAVLAVIWKPDDGVSVFCLNSDRGEEFCVSLKLPPNAVLIQNHVVQSTAHVNGSLALMEAKEAFSLNCRRGDFLMHGTGHTDKTNSSVLLMLKQKVNRSFEETMTEIADAFGEVAGTLFVSPGECARVLRLVSSRGGGRCSATLSLSPLCATPWRAAWATRASSRSSRDGKQNLELHALSPSFPWIKLPNE